MLTVALHALRTRWTTFTGSFIALSLGVSLLTVMGLALASSTDAPERRPERFAAAPVVVQGQNTLTLTTGHVSRETSRASDRASDRTPSAHVSRETRPLAHPHPVPEPVIAHLRQLGTVTPDRSFPVPVENGPHDLVGHPWSTAAFAPYEITAGRTPRTGSEVVTGTWAHPGQTLRTAHGTVTVVGTVASRGFENPVFYTDARAAELAPVSTQLVVEADPAAVRDVVGDTGQVLTGTDRRLADPDPDRDREALTAMNALFGMAGGVTAFVSVFVVASTFAFAVAQRRREFGLLRTAGATPGQIRRTVVAEALLVGVLASATGCALGGYGAPKLAARVVDEGLAPAWFTIGDATWPYHVAFWTGLLVALLGVIAASWRAGRTGPTQALREGSVDTHAMTWGRWLCGTALLLTAAATLGLALLTDPGDLLHRKTYVSRPMLLITAVALLAPALVRPLTRLVAWPAARLPGAVGMLVRENAAAGVRRTASVAAPVLVTVALAGSLLGATATLNEAGVTEIRERTAAAFVVTPAGDAGFDTATVKRLAAVDGAEASASASSAVYVLEEGVALIRSEARAVEAGPLAATALLPLTAGKVSGLDDDSIIVNEEWERHTVGQTVDVWLGDGTRRTLRIAAVMATGTGDNGVYVTPANARGAHVDRVDVALAGSADPAAVGAALREAVRGTGGQVFTKEQWVRASSPGTDGTTRLGFLLVLGIALLYTGISVANTMVMAASDRVRDLAVLRSVGATPWLVLRLTAAEALLVVAVGGVLGLLVAGLNLAGMRCALGLLGVDSGVELPWAALGTVVAACATLAVVSAVIPAGLTLRHAKP
ncbi:ABC transporter permease [Streptomyces sp. NPDC047072]|uniref:ABC transporter permease n=1 Tax=Streptomyces sp. NPDC047072 TaxID=3154809 RepID=UPI0033C0BCEF